MAEKKIKDAEGAKKKVKHTIVSATDKVKEEVSDAVEDIKGEEKPAAKPTVKPAAAVEGKEGALKYRIGAAALWLVAIAFEVIALLLLIGKINWTFMPTLGLIIIALVLDLICVVAGSLLWKKSNRLDPASEKNKVKFWLWNNMGVIVCAFAFIPFVIIALTSKQADKKTKTIAVIVAIIACLIGGLFSYDWNPISAEEKAEQIEAFADETVFWTRYGTVYHLSEDCSHLNNSDTLIKGSVEQAIEANKDRVCKDCEKNFAPSTSDADSDEKDVEIEGETEEEVKGLEIGTEETEEEGIALGIGG